MPSEINDITIAREEEGVEVIQELDKVVLSGGVWTTIIFKYRQWDRRKEGYSDDKFTIRRYKKFNDDYRQQSKFNISSADQARKIIEALEGWLGSM